MTELQEKVMKYIQKNKWPSMREISASVGSGVGNVHAAIVSLEKRGYIKRTPYLPRSIEVIRKI